jgi:hypothetical protein
VLVAVDDRPALPVSDRHRHDLVGEAAVFGGRHRPVMAADGILLLLFPGDAVLPAQVLRRLERPAGPPPTLPTRVSMTSGPGMHGFPGEYSGEAVS